jgi:23S rRNA pseudouridine1911/1915/1917 synthase
VTLDILFEDAAVLALNKPGGVLTQAPLGIDSLEFRVKRLLRERDPAAGDVYLGVPHRIDRPASGVILFAKTLKAAQKLSLQFERRFIAKTYWALVEGAVEPASGTWTDQVKKIEGEPRTVVVDADDAAGRKAVMHYRTLRSTSATLLEITLETGRTHQIRVQCASRGHALLGDELYGSRVRFGPWSDDERERRIALHARTLAFRHPTTREDLTLTAPLPDYWPSDGSDMPASLGEQVP